MIVDPHPKMHIDDLVILSKCYGQAMKKEMNEDIYKRVLTDLLKRWGQNKTHSRPSSTALTASEHVSLKVCNIVLKWSRIQTNYQINHC